MALGAAEANGDQHAADLPESHTGGRDYLPPWYHGGGVEAEGTFGGTELAEVPQKSSSLRAGYRADDTVERWDEYVQTFSNNYLYTSAI